jgi:Caspase domain
MVLSPDINRMEFVASLCKSGLRLRNAALAASRILAFFCLALSASARAEDVVKDRRIALVIGIGAYKHVEGLENPVNDAGVMKDKLAGLGFEVFSGVDLSKAEFSALVARFKAEALKSSTALVYYSGHGFQFQGQNYLVPADAVLKSRSDIDTQTVKLGEVISGVQARDRQVLVFLDACRNNPLPPSQRKNDGLSQVVAENNVFVAFATQPGNISYDGHSKLSPFTKAVVEHISIPGKSISDVMISVRNDVEKMTLGQQTPWDQSSLKKQFYFNEADSEGETVAMSGPDVVPGSGLSTLQRSTTIQPGTGLSIELGIASPLPGPNVILIPEAPVEIFGKEDLVSGVQEELKRVGCYAGDPDGVWGTTSRDALIKYYKTKKLKPTDTEPTEFHLENLHREEGIVCVYVPPKPLVQKYFPPKQARRPVIERQAPPARKTFTERPSKNRKTVAAYEKPKPRVTGRTPSPSSSPPAPPPPAKKSLADATLVGGFR